MSLILKMRSKHGSERLTIKKTNQFWRILSTLHVLYPKKGLFLRKRCLFPMNFQKSLKSAKPKNWRLKKYLLIQPALDTPAPAPGDYPRLAPAVPALPTVTTPAKVPVMRQATMVPSGKIKLCGAYNGPRGCVDRERDCPQKGKHWCSVILADGTVCKARDHCAVTHFIR